MNIRIFLLALVCAPLSVAQNASWHMPLVGRLDVPRIVNDTSIHKRGERYSALWGYTDSVTGREYAILGCYTGTSIIDVTDSAVEVGFIPGPPSLWREQKTFSHYAYVCTEQRGAGQGIQVIDIQNPAAPVLIKTFDSTLTGSHTVSIEGHYLFCNGTNNKLRILDLTNPRNPRDIGIDTSVAIPYIHDAYIRGDTMYASHVYNNTGVGIYDVRNKRTPVEITRFTYPGAGTHNSWPTADGKYLITTDEIGDTKRTCKVWDISDIHSATQVAEFTFSDSEITHNVVIQGTRAYVAHYSAGICVWDIRDIRIPVLIGYYDTYPEVVNGYNYEGAWGTYPFASGKVITSDRTHGLFVNTVQSSPVGRVHVTLLDSESLAPIPIAPVMLSTTALTGLPVVGHGRTDITGQIGVGIPDTGSATLSIARDTVSAPMLLPVHLISDSTIDLVVLLGTGLSVSGVHDAPTVSDFSLLPSFPNPARTTLMMHYASMNDADASIALYASNGARVMTMSARLAGGDHVQAVNTASLPAGAYVAAVTVGRHTMYQHISIIR